MSITLFERYTCDWCKSVQDVEERHYISRDAWRRVKRSRLTVGGPDELICPNCNDALIGFISGRQRLGLP